MRIWSGLQDGYQILWSGQGKQRQDELYVPMLQHNVLQYTSTKKYGDSLCYNIKTEFYCC